jgi:1,4-alpha-glucan branching enzyme
LSFAKSLKEGSPLPRVTFRLEYPTASEVFIAGSFNHWDPQSHPLKRTKKGHWSITITLPRGRHEYRYVVDGQWFTDPNTLRVPNTFGSENSVIVVE